jgi:catechol 2,3-dioxygenase-like lactoylglutathione lyase family enzyme
LGAIRETMEVLERGEKVTPHMGRQGKRNACYAAQLAMSAVQRLFHAAGASALFIDDPLQRQFRDVYAASAHHALDWEAAAAAYGRHRLGLEPTLSLLKLGHVAYRCHDVQRVVKFYTEALGFRVSDWRADRFAFLRCAVDHHTINFVADEHQRLYHIAFEAKDYAEIHRACDHLAKNDLRLVWGPGRHNIGHNVAIYHMNSDRVRVEIFVEMDQMKDESLGYFDPRPWHGDHPQRPKVWCPETLRNYWGPGSEPDLYKNM